MALYIIGIGGTGAKCVEAITQLSAAGLFPGQSSIKVFFVDADESNGNLERARNSLAIYQKCFNLIYKGSQGNDSPWMRTRLETFSPDLWSPFSNSNVNKNLAAFVGYNNLQTSNPDLAHLFDVLYSKPEQKVELDVGFRGRPAIGSAIMSQVNLDSMDQEPWRTIMSQIRTEAGGADKSTKVLFCGSIFGGTGASGLPTLAKLMDNKLKELNVRSSIKIGCLFVLPYFSFPPPDREESGDLYARSDLFLLNTEAALRYYETQAMEIFNSVYLLGNQQLAPVSKFSKGKSTQRNEPHFIELYAGLAAQHFLLNTTQDDKRVVLISRRGNGQLKWNDLPDYLEVKARLAQAARFAYAWLANPLPDLTEAKKSGVDQVQRQVWFTKFYRPKLSPLEKMFAARGQDLPDFAATAEEHQTVDVITNWCRDFLRWLYELHQYKDKGEDVQLLRVNLFGGLSSKLPQEEFCNLILDDDRTKDRLKTDTIQSLMERVDSTSLGEPRYGTSGLARSLYNLCRLEQ